LVATRACGELIAAAESELPYEVRGDPRVARFGEIAKVVATDKARITGRVKPPRALAIYNQNDWRCAVGSIVAVAARRAITAVVAFAARSAHLLPVAPTSALPPSTAASPIAFAAIASIPTVGPIATVAAIRPLTAFSAVLS